MTLANTARAACLGLLTLAGCTQPQTAAAPRSDAATSGPELAGAWYQVYFDTAGTDINARGKMIVQQVASIAAQDPTTRVTVIGTTDRDGPASANLVLSERRAEAVRNALISAGIPATRIDTSWTGEGKPVAPNADGIARARDRAVDITIIKTPG
jgi:OOP family OmpA-OmpF porin